MILLARECNEQVREQVRPDVEVELRAAGASASEFLILQVPRRFRGRRIMQADMKRI